MEKMEMKPEFTLELNAYGFKWGNVTVERASSQAKTPRFQILRVHCENGDCVEILIRPRSTKVDIYPNPEKL
jgi:hypothetical protein